MTEEEKPVFPMPEDVQEMLGAPSIKGLYEKLDVDPATIEELRKQAARDALLMLRYIYVIRLHGGALHKVNRRETAKRRAKNKVARKQRRVNRDRAAC